MTDEGAIADRVCAIVAKTMRIPVERVKLDSNLMDDLGAESIDFAEMIFALEAEFRIELEPASVFDKLEEALGRDVLAVHGALTERGAKILRERMPEVDPSTIVSGISVFDVQMLFTPATWVRAVQEVLDARPDRCPGCDSDHLVAEKISLLKCQQCGREVNSPAQGEVLTAWARRFADTRPDASR